MFEKTGSSSNGSSIELLERRYFPEARYEFLRCQLGKRIFETRRVGWRSTLGRSIEVTMELPVFHLLGYGATWDQAEEMINGPDQGPVLSQSPPWPNPMPAFSQN